MPHDSVSGAVRCPYYKSHTRLSVVCQWVGGSVLTQRFPSSQRRVKHVYKYCAAMEFGRCPLAAVMNCVYAKWLRPRARDAVPGPCLRLQSRSAACGSGTPPLPVAELGGVEEAGEKEQCERQ